MIIDQLLENIENIDNKEEAILLVEKAEEHFLREIDSLKQKLQNAKTQLDILHTQHQAKKLLLIYEKTLQIIDRELL